MKFKSTFFASILMVGGIFVVVSCGQSKKSSESISQVSGEQQYMSPEEMAKVANEKLTKDAVTERLGEWFRVKFGKKAKVKSIKDVSAMQNAKDNLPTAVAEGIMTGVVNDERGTYSFQAIVTYDQQTEFIDVNSMQMNHNGTMDCFYNMANGVMLSDNNPKMHFKYKGIKIDVQRVSSDAIRYVTSRHMTNDQIMNFIMNETDMSRGAYYFQSGWNTAEYAQFLNGDSPMLFNYDNGGMYNVEFTDDSYKLSKGK